MVLRTGCARYTVGMEGKEMGRRGGKYHGGVANAGALPAVTLLPLLLENTRHGSQTLPRAIRAAGLQRSMQRV